MTTPELDLTTEEWIWKLASDIVLLNKTWRKALKEALIWTVAGTDDFNCLDFDRADTSSILKLLGSFVLATREICFDLFSSMKDNEEYTKEIPWKWAYDGWHSSGWWDKNYLREIRGEQQRNRDRVSE